MSWTFSMCWKWYSKKGCTQHILTSLLVLVLIDAFPSTFSCTMRPWCGGDCCSSWGRYIHYCEGGDEHELWKQEHSQNWKLNKASKSIRLKNKMDCFENKITTIATRRQVHNVHMLVGRWVNLFPALPHFCSQKRKVLLTWELPPLPTRQTNHLRWH